MLLRYRSYLRKHTTQASPPRPPSSLPFKRFKQSFPSCSRFVRGESEVGMSYPCRPCSLTYLLTRLHKGFTAVSPGLAGFSQGFAGFRGGFAGVSRGFRPIRKPTNRFSWFSNPSLATQSFAKFTSLSHVSLHFRSVSQGNFTKFRSRFTAVSHAFARFHNVSLVKRCDGVT